MCKTIQLFPDHCILVPMLHHYHPNCVNIAIKSVIAMAVAAAVAAASAVAEAPGASSAAVAQGEPQAVADESSSTPGPWTFATWNGTGRAHPTASKLTSIYVIPGKFDMIFSLQL